MITQTQLTVGLIIGTIIILKFAWAVIKERARLKALQDYYDEIYHFHEGGE